MPYQSNMFPGFLGSMLDDFEVFVWVWCVWLAEGMPLLQFQLKLVGECDRGSDTDAEQRKGEQRERDSQVVWHFVDSLAFQARLSGHLCESELNGKVCQFKVKKVQQGSPVDVRLIKQFCFVGHFLLVA